MQYPIEKCQQHTLYKHAIYYPTFEPFETSHPGQCNRHILIQENLINLLFKANLLKTYTGTPGHGERSLLLDNFKLMFIKYLWQKKSKVYLYIKPGFGTSFNKHNVQLPSLRLRFLCGDLPVVMQRIIGIKKRQQWKDIIPVPIFFPWIWNLR